MLQRSEGSTGSSSEVSESDKLIGCLEKCAKDVDCISACYGEEEEDSSDDKVVRAGDLVVTATAAGERKALIGGISDLDTLTFKTSEDVTISKVTLERYGYSANKNIAQIWLEDEDGNVISNKVENFGSKGQVNLTIKKEYRSVDGSYNATIVVETKPATYDDDADPATPEVTNPDAAVAGSTLGFKVVAVESTAENLNLDDYTPYTYDMVVYDGVNVRLTNRGGNKNYDFAAGEMFEVAKFKIEAPADSAILVKGFTLENEGNFVDVEKYLDEFSIAVAGEEVKASYSFNKEDELVISLSKDLKIAAKDKVEVIISMSFTSDLNSYGGTIGYRITPTTVTQFNAIDAKTESRVQVTNATAMFTYTFNGGNVKLSSEKLGAVDAAIKTSDVKVAEGKLTLAEAIKVAKNGLTIDVTSSFGNVSGIIDRLVLVIDGEEYQGTRGVDGTTVTYSFPAIEIEESGKVEVLIDTLDAAAYEGSTLTFTMDGWDNFYYSADRSLVPVTDIVAGALNFSKVTIQGAKSSLTTNSLKSNVEFKNKQADSYSVYEGTFTAKKADIKLNSFTVTANTLAAATDLTVLGTAMLKPDGVTPYATPADDKNLKLTFHLFLDGEEVADEVLAWDATAGAWIIDAEDFRDVKVNAEKSIPVKLVADVDATRLYTLAAPITLGSFLFQLDGVDNNDTAITPVSRSTSTIKVVESGTPTVSDGAAKKTVLLKAAGKEIAQFIIKPANGASELEIDSISFDVNVTGGDTVSTDDLVFSVDNEDKEVAVAKAAAATLNDVTYDNLLIKTDSNGATVKIVLDAEIAGTITIDDLKVNGTSFASRSYIKRFEDAIAYIASQNGGKGTTKLTMGVETYDSTVEVKNLRLYVSPTEIILANGEISTAPIADAAAAVYFSQAEADTYNATLPGAIDAGDADPGTAGCTDAASCTQAEADAYNATLVGAKTTADVKTAAVAGDYTIAGVFTNGDVVEAVEGNTVKMITAIEYQIGNNPVITIDKSEFSDYFKVGADESAAKIFKND